MRKMQLGKAFTLMESGPVVLVTPHDGDKDNIMTISWTNVIARQRQRAAIFRLIQAGAAILY